MDVSERLPSFKFTSYEFDEKSMLMLADHPLYGPYVKRWMAEGRKDWRTIKKNLAAIKERAKRQKMWLNAYDKLGDEKAACKKAMVTYATFYKWKEDEQFKALYGGVRESHAFELLKKARELGMEEANSTDRWNIIKTEIPEYNPKAKAASVNLNFNTDIEFAPRGGTRPIDTTAVPDGEIV